jgi:hypothetical protein
LRRKKLNIFKQFFMARFVYFTVFYNQPRLKKNIILKKGDPMIRRLSGMLATVVAVCATGAYSQTFTFNGPMPWVTQRNDSITVRAQIDTSQLKKKKEITIEVVLVNDQAKKKALAKKSFPINDNTGEFALGPVQQALVGGRSYIKIDWSIPGTTSKGSLLPLGIVALDKIAQPTVVQVPRAKEGADAAAVVSLIKESDFRTTGAAKFAFAWNKDGLYIVLVKQAMAGSLRFAIDGKNGKNAFLSFADRVVVYSPDNDSLKGVHYARGLAGDTLKYVDKPWPNEFVKTVSGDKIVILVPWFDSGVIPFEERILGLGVMIFDAKGQQTAAFPAGADFYLPGKWADLQLAK